MKAFRSELASTHEAGLNPSLTFGPDSFSLLTVPCEASGRSVPLRCERSNPLNVHEIVLNVGLTVIGDMFSRRNTIEVFEGVVSLVAVFVVDVMFRWNWSVGVFPDIRHTI